MHRLIHNNPCSRPRRLDSGAIALRSAAALALAAALVACPQPKAPSDNANLGALSLSAGTLSPAFDPAVTDYSVALGRRVASLTVTATASDPGAALAGDAGSAKNLAYGETSFAIEVTAADGRTVKTYRVAATRAAPLPCTLSFDGNAPDSSGSLAAISLKQDESGTLPANAFARSGYSFLGWATSAAGPLAYADGANYTMGETSATLYAAWGAGEGISADVPIFGSESSALGAASFITKGQALTASVSNTALRDFSWYLDGVRLEGYATRSISLPTSGLNGGWHYLMYVASDANGIPYSVGRAFQVLSI